MKKFKDLNNKIHELENDCFDNEGNCINEIARKVIEENNLVEITQEEAEAIKNYKSPEQLAEQERLAKLPSEEEVLNAKIEMKAIELLTELELI